MGKASRRKQLHRTDNSDHQGAALAATSRHLDPHAVYDEEDWMEVFRLLGRGPSRTVIQAWADGVIARISLVQSIDTAVKLVCNDPAAASQYLGYCDPCELLLLGYLVPEVPSAEQLAVGAAAWFDHLAAGPSRPVMLEFLDALATVEDATGEAIDSDWFSMRLAAELASRPLLARSLPAADRPRQALAGHPVTAGFATPDLPASPAPTELARWKASLGITPDLAGDGSPADALRVGADALSARGDRGWRREAVDALVALRVGYAANKPLDETIVTTEAWALGVPAHSELAEIVGLVMASVAAGESFDVAVSRVLAHPGARTPMAADASYRAQLGGTAADLLFAHTELRRVEFCCGAVVKMAASFAARMEEQKAAFEAKFGRPPTGDDPVFFDPDADDVRHIDPDTLHVELIEALTAVGVSAQALRATAATDLFPARPGCFVSAAFEAEYRAALAGAFAADGVTDPAVIDATMQADGALLESAAANEMLRDASCSPATGATLATGAFGEAVREAVEVTLDHALDLAGPAREALAGRARELAFAWSGLTYAERVARVFDAWDAGGAEIADLPAAACLAVAARAA